MTNASFTVVPINTNDLSDQTCTLCPTWNGMKVYASNNRGTYKGLSVNSIGRYHAAYGNDTWVMNKFLTLNGGVRWEEQRVGGTVLKYPFTGNWSPRVGANVDPFGDRKGKIFFNYGRNYWAMPLDAANRQLGNEQDDTGLQLRAGDPERPTGGHSRQRAYPERHAQEQRRRQVQRSQLLLFHRRGNPSRNQVGVRG